MGCYSEKEKNTAKFVALESQGDAFGFNLTINFLAKKVHKSKLIIDVGFADNKTCGFTDSYRRKLYTSITQSLSVWLAPLKDRTDVTDDIVGSMEIRKGNIDEQQTFLQGVKFFKERSAQESSRDLGIIFYCEEGRSFALVDDLKNALSNIENEAIPTLHIKKANYQYYSNQNPKGWINGVIGYRKEIIHHEMGHAFGLSDTYVDSSTNSLLPIIRHNTSDGGDMKTVGNQALSIMSSTKLGLDSAGKLRLLNDDIAGINWLYDYYIKKNISSTDCPDDYKYEEATIGCVPRYPLIFAVKQNNFSAIRRLLEHDDTIDIDEQDDLGNTALHYAAYSQTLHGDTFYKFLVNRGAKENIPNKDEKTASAIARKQKESLLSYFKNLQPLLKTISKAVKNCRLDGTMIVGCNDQEEIRSLLNKMDINAQTKNGQTLLHQAVIKGETKVIEFLLTLDHLDLEAKNSDNKTAIHEACRLTIETINELLTQDNEYLANKKHCYYDSNHLTRKLYKNFYKLSFISFALGQKQTSLWQNNNDCQKINELRKYRCEDI